MNDLRIMNAIAEIRHNHKKIINDWCKAYMAELYGKTGQLNPGDWSLVETELVQHEGHLVKKYWFEPKTRGYKHCPHCGYDHQEEF